MDQSSKACNRSSCEENQFAIAMKSLKRMQEDATYFCLRMVSILNTVVNVTEMLTPRPDELSHISLGEKFIHDAIDFLTKVSSDEPRVRRFCRAIIEWHENTDSATSIVQSRSIESSTACDSNKMVHVLLNVTQGLVVSKESIIQEDATSEDDAGHIRRNYLSYTKLAAASKTNAVLPGLAEVLSQLVGQDKVSIRAVLGHIIPYLDRYLCFTQSFLSSYANWAKSLFKLAYIHGSLLLSLAEKGFCRLQEEEQGDGADGQLEDGDGTGVGTGTGEQNISEEMQDESQFEGLRGEKDEPGGEKSQDDNAVDVDFDLNADLEDGDLQEGEESGDDNSDQADLDDEFGLNETGDFDEIDEDFWGEEDKEQDRANDDGQDQNGQKSQAQTEMTAMEVDEEDREKRNGEDSPVDEAEDDGELEAQEEEGDVNSMDESGTRDDVQNSRDKECDDVDMQSIAEEADNEEPEPSSVNGDHAMEEPETPEEGAAEGGAPHQTSDVEDDISEKDQSNNGEEDSTSDADANPGSCDKADVGPGEHAEKDTNEGGNDITGESGHSTETHDVTKPEETEVGNDAEPVPTSFVFYFITKNFSCN